MSWFRAGGHVSLDRVADALSGLGWTPKPLDTSRHDEAHVEGSTDTQRRTGGASPEWERQAHAEADRNRS